MTKDIRWIKFWPQDWQRDPALRICSLAARGLWIDLLCIMHEGEPYGHLTINGKAPSHRQVGTITGVSEREATRLLKELEEAGVFSRDEDGTIFSRRMCRDKKARDAGVQNGRTGGNPSLLAPDNLSPNFQLTGGVNPPSNLLEAEAESEEEKKDPPSLRSVPPDKGGTRGTRLPADWQPTAVDRAFAVNLGLQPTAVAAMFADFWHAKAGADARKVDWPATWRVWCRRDADRARPPPRRDTTAELFREMGINLDDPDQAPPGFGGVLQ